jgi:hypothetical protein
MMDVGHTILSQGAIMQGEPTNIPENGCLQKRVRTATAAGLGGLKAFSPYAWVPILFVSIISATLAYRNFSAQQSGNRPEMIFNRVNLQNPYDDDGLFDLGMLNVGTRTAYNYRLVITTAELVAGKSTTLANVTSSNPIRRDGGASVAPHLDMSKYLDALILCVTYRDDNDKVFEDQMFVQFPTMTRGRTKDKGGGGQYPTASVSPDDYEKLDKMHLCTE